MSRLQCGESLGCRRRHPAPCSLTHNSLLQAEGLAWGPGALHLLTILGKGFSEPAVPFITQIKGGMLLGEHVVMEIR